MDSLTEQVAAELLRRDGAAVIWQAYETAARAHRDGNPKAAEILLRIADAAEQAVRRDTRRPYPSLRASSYMVNLREGHRKRCQ